MTTPSPNPVKYEYEAYVIPLIDPRIDLPVRNIVVSMDRDRYSLIEATIVCDWIDDTLFNLLDPRLGARVFWRVEQQDEDGTHVGWLPNMGGFHEGRAAEMWVRSVTRDAVNLTATVSLAGGETYMQDKKRNSGTTTDTGATTVAGLVGWALGDVFGGYAISSAAITLTTSIPSGDRRLMVPGETFMDLIQPELDAIDCRLEDRWGIIWETRVRSAVSTTFDVATLPGIADTDPIVYGYTETLTRETDWYDGVAVKFDTTDIGGGVTLQRTGAGFNTRGLYVTKERAAPASNAADQILTRTLQRGYEIEITARARFDVDAYSTINVYLPDSAVRTARVRSIEWDIAASEMRIRAQAGEPEE